MSIDVRPSHGAKVRRTLIYRRARACPSPTSGSPKASSQDRLILTCSRSGDRELQGPVSRRRGDRGGQAPALRGRSISLANVGRGPVPRHRRYHRRAGSPDPDLFAIRRSRTTGARLAPPRRSRGTGPRATVRTETHPENPAHILLILKILLQILLRGTGPRATGPRAVYPFTSAP